MKIEYGRRLLIPSRTDRSCSGRKLDFCVERTISLFKLAWTRKCLWYEVETTKGRRMNKLPFG